MQTCKKCKQEMVPKVNMAGDVADILRRVAADAEFMRWSCPNCKAEREAPMKPDDVKQVRNYVRKQKKKWWQFWI